MHGIRIKSRSRIAQWSICGEKAEDLERVKQYVGADKIQDIIDNVKEAERLQAEQKRLQRSYQNRMSR